MRSADSGINARVLVLGAFLVLVTQLSGPAWGQGWQPCGANTCAASGNVGIGTTAPGAKLDVQSSAGTVLNLLGTQASGDSAGSTTYVWGNRYGTTFSILGFGNTNANRSSTLQIGAFNSEQSIAIATDDSAAIAAGTSLKGIFIRSGGNVGIGTTSPVAGLHLAGALQALFLQYGQSATTSDNWHVGVDGASGSMKWGVWQGNYGYGTNRLVVLNNGNIGIGTLAPQYKLSVNGIIGTKEIVVTNTGWADYVFKPGYRLGQLSEVAAYIKENHRLPDIPSEHEVQQKGVSLGEMQVKLLAKIEELTLHMIREHERNERLERQNQDLQERVAQLEKRSGAKR